MFNFHTAHIREMTQYVILIVREMTQYITLTISSDYTQFN
jgi:hypothetical protein